MSRITWDDTGKRLFETGVDQGVFYPQSADGKYETGAEAWNGLINVTEKPSGAEPTALWADNIKYAELTSSEEFGASVEAYTYPEGFALCDGSAELAPGIVIGGQDRKNFGFSYRTLIGNDVEGTAHGYIIHLVYGAKAAPTEKQRNTVNENPDAATFTWDVTTTPVKVTGHKPTAHLQLKSTVLEAKGLKAIEDVIYGAGEVAARLPLPDEILSIYNEAMKPSA